MPTGTVQMDAAGAFYVTTDAKKPLDADDAVTHRMNRMLREINQTHGWEITNSHIKPHVPITTAEWELDDNGYGEDWEVESFEVSMEWYSQDQIHHWND